MSYKSVVSPTRLPETFACTSTIAVRITVR